MFSDMFTNISYKIFCFNKRRHESNNHNLNHDPVFDSRIWAITIRKLSDRVAADYGTQLLLQILIIKRGLYERILFYRT